MQIFTESSKLPSAATGSQHQQIFNGHSLPLSVDALSPSSPQSSSVLTTNFTFVEDKTNYVGTTPRIILSSRAPSRYEQGLEDYEEAVARVEQTKETARSETSDGLGALYSIFSVLNSAWTKASEQSTKNKLTKRNDRIEFTTQENGNSTELQDTDDDDNSSDDDPEETEVEEVDEEDIEEYSSGDDAVSDVNGEDNDNNNKDANLNNDTSSSSSTAVEEGRYIKGDPLKGYYDFIITEGSYKFWAGFQLFTALLMIYSTFAAIYYSKVNPIVSDYDYVSYLGGARSMASDPEPTSSDSAYHLSSLLNGHWLQTAAHGVEFVLESIDRIPQSS